jgi:hypothetical protein
MAEIAEVTVETESIVSSTNKWFLTDFWSIKDQNRQKK